MAEAVNFDLIHQTAKIRAESLLYTVLCYYHHQKSSESKAAQDAELVKQLNERFAKESSKKAKNSSDVPVTDMWLKFIEKSAEEVLEYARIYAQADNKDPVVEEVFTKVFQAFIGKNFDAEKLAEELKDLVDSYQWLGTSFFPADPEDSPGQVPK